MPVPRTLITSVTLPEKRAVALFILHSGLRSRLVDLHRRASPANYLRHYDADAATAYFQEQWVSLRRHINDIPLTFRTACKDVHVLVDAGWAEPFPNAPEGYYRWNREKIRTILKHDTLAEALGVTGYVKFIGHLFFGYLRTIFAGMKLDPSITNEKAEELLVSDDRFVCSYGQIFGKEVHRVWTPQQAIAWATDEIPICMKDLTDAHKVLTAMLVRIYTGVHANQRVRTKFGNWRPGMVAAPRTGIESV